MRQPTGGCDGGQVLVDRGVRVVNQTHRRGWESLDAELNQSVEDQIGELSMPPRLEIQSTPFHGGAEGLNSAAVG